MIEVIVRNPATGLELARIEIKNLVTYDDETADYSVQFAVERGMAVGLHQRGVDKFPRKHYNVLALLRQVLNTLEPKELELERGFDPDEGTETRPPRLTRRHLNIIRPSEERR